VHKSLIYKLFIKINSWKDNSDNFDITIAKEFLATKAIVK